MAEKERETPNILVIVHNIYLKTYTLCISVSLGHSTGGVMGITSFSEEALTCPVLQEHMC